MKNVLIIAHGSKKTEQNAVFVDIIDMVRNLVGEDYTVDGAFMSLDDMKIESKLSELIEQGATEIIIVPYLLFSGKHFLKTIPNKIKEFMKEYPMVDVTFREPLGSDKRLAEILVDRINKK